MRRIFAITGLLFAFLSCEKSISEFQYENFLKYFGGGSGSCGYSVVELTNGGYIVTGFDRSVELRKQVFVARLDKAGNTVWENNFGTVHDEEGIAVDVLNDEIFIAGNRTNYITGAEEAFLLKVGFNGDSLSCQSFGGDLNAVVNHMLIVGGNIYVAGETYESNPLLANYYIACISPVGELVWQRSYGNLNGRQVYKKLLYQANGNIAAFGTNNAITGSEQTHVTYTELNTQGIPTSGLNFPLSQNQSFGDVLSVNNEFYILYSANAEQLVSCHAAKISDGVISWDVDLSITGTGTTISQSSNGNLIITSSGNGLVTYSTASISSDGTNTQIKELKAFPGEVYSTMKTADGGLISIGTTSLSDDGMVRVIKTDPNLHLLNP